MVKIKNIGSRAEVWHGVAKKTNGQLEKKDLIKNKIGRIVSKKKSLKHSKDPNKNPLLKIGYQRKKGSKEFGPVKEKTVEKSLNKTKTVKKSLNKTNKNKNKSWFSKLFSS